MSIKVTATLFKSIAVKPNMAVQLSKVTFPPMLPKVTAMSPPETRKSTNDQIQVRCTNFFCSLYFLKKPVLPMYNPKGNNQRLHIHDRKFQIGSPFCLNGY